MSADKEARGHTLDWSTYQVVLAVARGRGIERASEILNTSPQTARRRLAAAEAAHDARLFERSASGYVPTLSGRAVLAAAEQIERISSNLDAGSTMSGRHPTGSVVVTTGLSFTYEVVRRNLRRFHTRYPEIQVELLVTDEIVDLSRGDADLAFRPTHISGRESDLVRRYFCDVGFAVYGSADYLEANGTPKRFADLNQHSMIMHKRDRHYYFAPVNWVADQVEPRSIPLVTNSPLAMLDSVSQNVGLAVLPCFLADKVPNLVRVFGGREELVQSLWIYTHGDLQSTPAIRAFVRYISTAVEADRARLLGAFY